PGPAPNKLKKLAVPIEELGSYFLRIQAATAKDESDFSVACAWEEKPEETPEEPTVPGKPPKIRRPHAPKADKPPPVVQDTVEAKLEKGTEGRIVQAHREKGKMV